MLDVEDRAKLTAFVKQSPPGGPYLKRALIVLSADDGATQEMIAAELNVPITRVRQMLRAFNREGIMLFPDSIWSMVFYAADEPIIDMARKIIFSLTAKLEAYEPELKRETSVKAVHETRKTVRRMRTALTLFESYFEDGLLRKYRKRSRKFMRGLGRSRDVAVFHLKLEDVVMQGTATDGLTDGERATLQELAQYWQGQQAKIDHKVRRRLAKGKYQRLLDDLASFGCGHSGRPAPMDPWTPRKARHLAPIMIYDKLASVRALGDQIEGSSLDQLHALRISCKELRYTLEFFEPLLGPPAAECIAAVKRILAHLGDVNDARVHLKMLDGIQEPAIAGSVELYRRIVEDQLKRLRESFPAVWLEFDQQAWREQLALAVAVL
ncbi:MAG: CHAD domain-containing protein [Chloroflexota bacterium]|nr:MAG: CHAD domain-containing protein [Chloroflexota bacterium]